ncbi:sensor histidine kinase [Undibacterium terreum]|uniref:histidine kinase n=1 Tax=Undibacterium terreum TaxID=1224302 RepID=A0A916U1T3_9BURK|nr:HAMP domain-containing sensor histidine kinase [Undibacterium terreum]GGC57331.1 two-component sensor histidine kinase [Undibacterium terreum]
MLKSLKFSGLTVALVYVAVSLVVLAAFATPLWLAWRETIEDGRVKFLKADTQRLIAVFNKGGLAALAPAIEIEVGTSADGAEKIILLADAAFRPLAGNLPAWPKELSTATGTYKLSITIGKQPLRVALLSTALPGGYHLLVANDIAKYRRLENFFLYGLLGAAGIVLALGTAGGFYIRRMLLSQVKDINRATSAIMLGNFSHRLPAHGGESELNILVETQNRMLDQIEHLVEGIRNVSNAIAHDLRTPLAELRSRLEELSLTRPEPELTFTEIECATADVDRVISIFNALLRLAEIDSGIRRSGFIKIDARTIAAEAVEFYQPVAEIREVDFSFLCAESLPLWGDPLLIAQAIGNLIDNALKYVPEKGSITVNATRGAGGGVEIVVADNGPGIPAEERPKVLERFYRGDTSRGTPGAGLGLSLVAAVAKLHGGDLLLADNSPGLRATLVLSTPEGEVSSPQVI